MIIPEQVYRKTDKIVVRKIKNESVIVPVTNDMSEMEHLYTLNPTATFIWEQIDGTNTAHDISLKIEEEFEVDSKQAKTDVIEFMNKIAEFLVPA